LRCKQYSTFQVKGNYEVLDGIEDLDLVSQLGIFSDESQKYSILLFISGNTVETDVSSIGI
jgi:hypothetical protein